jgi:dihydroorotase
MTILVQQVLIKDINSPHNNTIRDILIHQGKIQQIAENISALADKTIEAGNLSASPGWVDIFVSGTDPGFEFRDDLDSLSAAAAKGGFTHVFLTPNTQPVTQNKTGVEYISRHHASAPVKLHPIGAISKNTEGKELTEIYDMHQSGAVAFSDGNKPVQSAGLLIKALQYVTAFKGTIIQVPDDKSIAPHGLMNESVVSTQVGLPGKPALAEEIMVARDIALAKYTGAHLHLTGISLASSVNMINKAKADGIPVTASTTTHHLTFTENDLLRGYNTNLKVNPPLRSEADRQALLAAVKDGIIDIVTTHHTPQHTDAKICEFEYAGYGMLGLEAAFGVLQNAGLSVDEILQVICYNPRKIFNLNGSISEGESADLTFFKPDETVNFTADNLGSKSKNCPYIHTTLKGHVIGQTYLNQSNL